jgi:hypothetical protein
MAQAFHSISDFVSQVKKFDLARANRYEVLFFPPPIMQDHYTSSGESPKLLSMFVEDVLFPGLIIGTRAYRLNNLNQQRATSIDFMGDSIAFTILVDTSWTVKDFIGDWMRKIVDPVSREIEYPNEYYGRINLFALNNQDEVVAEWQLEDVFPRSMAPISGSATNAQVLRLPVSFAYTRWRVIGGYDPEGNPLSYSADPQFQLDEDFTDDLENVDQSIADIEADIAST